MRTGRAPIDADAANCCPPLQHDALRRCVLDLQPGYMLCYVIVLTSSFASTVYEKAKGSFVTADKKVPTALELAASAGLAGGVASVRTRRSSAFRLSADTLTFL